MPAGDADVAADALADVLLTALVDLVWKKRIGDRRPGRADQIQHATANLADHAVGRSEATHADHGLAGDLLDEVDDRLVTALGCKPRRGAVGWGRIQLHVPEVRDVGKQLDHLVGLGCRHLAGARAELLEAYAQRDRATASNRIARHFEQFAHDSHPIAHRAAIGIRTLIPLGYQKFVRQIAHAGVDVHNVEPGAARLARCFALPLQQ